MRSPGLRFRWIVCVLSVGDVRTRGGDGTAEVLKMGRGGLCQWFQWGAVDDKVWKVMRKMLGKALLSLGG